MAKMNLVIILPQNTSDKSAQRRLTSQKTVLKIVASKQTKFEHVHSLVKPEQKAHDVYGRGGRDFD